MNANIISVKDNLVETVAGFLTATGQSRAGGADYSRNLVVFPGKRPRHFLLRHLAGREQSSLWPPQIFSIDGFIDELFSQYLGRGEQPLTDIDAVALLFDLHERQSFGGEKGFETLDAFLPLGMKLLRELEEIRIELVDPAKLRSIVLDFDFPEYENVSMIRDQYRHLSVVYEHFYNSVAQYGGITRAGRYRAVADKADEIDLSEFECVVLAGFYALNGSEKRLFKRLLRSGNTHLVAQNGPGLSEELRALGIDVPSYLPPSPPELSFYSASDTHGQVYGLNRVLAESLKRGEKADERTLILLPDTASLFPLLRNTGPLLPEDAMNISMGYPVRRTPVYAAINSMFTLLATGEYGETGELPVREYLAFALHPYIKNMLIEQRSDVTRILFHTIEEEFFQGSSRLTFTLEELETSDVFARATRRLDGILDGVDAERFTAEALRLHLRGIHDNTLRLLLGAKDLGSLAMAVIRVLTFIDERSTAWKHPYFRPFVERIMSVLQQLSASRLARSAIDRPEAAFNFVRQYLSDVMQPFSGTPLEGLQVLGLLEVRNLSFERVFVLNANDSVLPGEAGVDFLLPLPLREKLGLHTYRDEQRRTAYYFELLTRGATEVHFFFSTGGGELRSRYVEQYLWDLERRDAEVREINPYVSTVSLKLDLKNPRPGEIAKTAVMIESLKSRRYSASALNNYLACPRRFYFQNVLGLREKEEAGAEPESSTVGTLVHAILEQFHRPHRERLLIMDDLDERPMLELVDRQFAKEFRGELRGRLYLMREKVRSRMTEYLHEYLRPLIAGGIAIESVEGEYHATDFHGHKLYGKIDRVERREGRIVISDYKTGGPRSVADIRFEKRGIELTVENREQWNDFIPSLQLPFYMLLYASSENVSAEAITAQYIWLGAKQLKPGGNKSGRVERPVFESPEQAAEHFPVLEEIIRRLLDEITGAEHPFRPPADLESTCVYCSFKTMCGTQWVRKKW